MIQGIVRSLDSLGRVVIPKEMRSSLKVMNGDKVMIMQSDNSVIIKKYTKGCFFCGCSENLVEHKDVCICSRCLSIINSKRLL